MCNIYVFVLDYEKWNLRRPHLVKFESLFRDSSFWI